MSDKKVFIPANQIVIIEDSGMELLNIAGRFNPRGLDNEGWQPERMERLRKSIMENGLDMPLLVRRKGDKYQLLAGERRLRSIMELCDSNEPCYNQVTKKKEPAREVYIKLGVECKVKECEREIDYLCISVYENVLHEPLSDFDKLVQVSKLEAAGVSREEQAEVMGKVSEAWISQSHTILKLHPRILELIREGKLSRTAAITFINVDSTKIEKVLDRAMQLTYSEASEKVAEANAEINESVNDMEEAAVSLSIANYLGDDGDLIRKSRRTISAAGKKFARASKKINSAKSNDTLTDAIVLQAARDVTAAGKIKRPRVMKEIRKISEELLEKLECDEAIFNRNGVEVDKIQIKTCHRILQWVLNGADDSHPLDLLGEFTEAEEEQEQEDRIVSVRIES